MKATCALLRYGFYCYSIVKSYGVSLTHCGFIQGDTSKETEDPRCVVHARYSLQGLYVIFTSNQPLVKRSLGISWSE
jgi:hypothetical protein